MEAEKIKRSDAPLYGIRSFAWQGIVSSMLLIIQIILLSVSVYLSYLEHGNGGSVVGILGAVAFMLSVAGTGFAIWGAFKKGKNHLGCFIGGVGSFAIAVGIVLLCTVIEF